MKQKVLKWSKSAAVVNHLRSVRYSNVKLIITTINYTLSSYESLFYINLASRTGSFSMFSMYTNLDTIALANVYICCARNLACTKIKRSMGHLLLFKTHISEEHLEQNDTVQHENEISKIVHEIGDVLVVIIKSIIHIFYDQQTIHKFSTGPPNDHSCKVTIQLA